MTYIKEMRQRLGYDEDDDTPDERIKEMAPLERVSLIVGWYHGDPR
jgi:hypothetical protein